MDGWMDDWSWRYLTLSYLSWRIRKKKIFFFLVAQVHAMPMLTIPPSPISRNPSIAALSWEGEGEGD